MEYTKGEWKAIKGILSDEINTIVGDKSQGIAEIVCYLGQNVEADAHLISAAPDMYEALKEARHEIERLAMVTGYEGEAHFPKLEQINKAIAKAEGK